MANYVLLNDDYLASDYVESAYVGTADDLYVETGYIQDAIQGVVSVSAVSTVTTNGGQLLDGSANSNSAVSVVSSARSIRPGSTNSNSAVSVLSSAVSTLQGTITPISAGTVTITANAIVDRSSDISVSANLSVDGDTILDGIVDIQAFQTHETTWAQDISWDSPVGTIWGPMVDVTAKTISLAAPPGNIESRFTFTVDGDVTAVAEISPAAVASVDVSGSFIVRPTIPTISTAFDTLTDGDRVGTVANLELSGQFDVSVEGIFQVEGRPLTQNAAFDVSIDGDVIRDGISINAGAFTVTDIPPSRIRPFASSIDAQFTTLIDADAFSRGVSINSGVFGLDVDANKITDANITSSSAFGEIFKGGKLTGGIIDITGFFTSVSALSLYNIDPFRVYTIDTETRQLGIVQETRIYNTKSENRLNSIQAENRLTRVPSETRALEVQLLKLVELKGIKDRRTE